jgi:magnesium transporter
MIRYFTKHSSAEGFQEITVPPAEGGIWVYAEQPTDAELEKLISHYKLDRNIIRDLHDSDELPRAENSGDAFYVFLRTAGWNKHGEVVTAPVLLITTPKAYLALTALHALPLTAIMKAAEREGIRTTNASGLLISTLAAIMGQYEELIQRTSRYIKDIHHRLRAHEVGNSDFVHFVTVEDNLHEYAQNMSEMMAVAERLREDKLYKLSRQDQEALDDTLLHMKQLIMGVKSYAVTIASIRNTYGTIANNNLNRRMKTLTVFTVLIALPNLFYGMYGMNVALPFQHSAEAYVVIVLFTIVLTLGVYALGKRLRIF